MQNLDTFEHYVRHYSKKVPGARQVRGLYDLSRVPFKLGNVLLFAQNLRVVQALAQVPHCRFEFVTDRGFLNRSLSSEELPQKIDWASRLARTYSGLDYVGVYDGPVTAEDIVFPLPETQWDHKSYLFTWVAERQTGVRVRPDYVHASPKAAELIAHSRKPVFCLHPKSDQREQSNAILEIWSSLIARLTARFQPVVVASDAYPRAFREEAKGRGALFTQELGLDIFDESYLIHHGTGFLGIASGPSNFAILSNRPYLIIKHSEDAWAEKFQEVVDDRLPMAGAHQYFHIGREDSGFVEEKVDRWP